MQLKRRFLEHFRRHGNVSWACKESGLVRRAQVYEWQEHDESFAAAFRLAEVEATEVLERELFRRAVEGVERTRFDPDGRAYTEQTYSDTLLIVALKARAPEKYRERYEFSGPGGGPLRVEYVNDWRNLPADDAVAGPAADERERGAFRQ